MSKKSRFCLLSATSLTLAAGCASGRADSGAVTAANQSGVYSLASLRAVYDSATAANAGRVAANMRLAGPARYFATIKALISDEEVDVGGTKIAGLATAFAGKRDIFTAFQSHPLAWEAFISYETTQPPTLSDAQLAAGIHEFARYLQPSKESATKGLGLFDCLKAKQASGVMSAVGQFFGFSGAGSEIMHRATDMLATSGDIAAPAAGSGATSAATELSTSVGGSSDYSAAQAAEGSTAAETTASSTASTALEPAAAAETETARLVTGAQAGKVGIRQITRPAGLTFLLIGGAALLGTAIDNSLIMSSGCQLTVSQNTN